MSRWNPHGKRANIFSKAYRRKEAAKAARRRAIELATQRRIQLGASAPTPLISTRSGVRCSSCERVGGHEIWCQHRWQENRGLGEQDVDDFESQRICKFLLLVRPVPLDRFFYNIFDIDGKKKVETRQCLVSTFCYLLRGADSNRRPAGYEPAELPLLYPASFIVTKLV